MDAGALPTVTIIIFSDLQVYVKSAFFPHSPSACLK
jgi:hypothetical protein